MTNTVTGTNGTAEDFYIYPQTWTGNTVTSYQDYDIVNFELGADTLYIPFDGGFAALSSVADFQQAMLDIEATGDLGWSAIGTSYTIDGNDVVFSWDGQGEIRLEGLAPTLDLGESLVTYEASGDEGTARQDTIEIDRDSAWEGAVFDTGFGDDVVTVAATDAQGWVSISNSGGSDTIDVSALGEFESAFIWGADDINEVENVTTGAGDDVVNTYAGDDVISTGAGDDEVFATSNGDKLVDLGIGQDEFHFSAQNDSTVTVTGNGSLANGGNTYNVYGSNDDGTLVITDFDWTEMQGNNVVDTGYDFLVLQGTSVNNENQLDALINGTSSLSASVQGDDLYITDTSLNGTTTVVLEDAADFWM